MITDLCVISQGTIGDILSNQHLLPITTEVYRQMTCHVVTYCVMMCGFDGRENKGVSLDTRGRRSQWDMEKQGLTCRAGGLCEWLMTNKVIHNSHMG